MSVNRAVVTRLRQRNMAQFEDLSRLHDLVDELQEQRRQAREIAESLSTDVPQRHKLLKCLA